MIWTLLSLVCVIALKIFGEWRIKDLKIQHRRQAPELGKLRSRLKKLNRHATKLTNDKQHLEKRMGFIKDAIQNMEKSLHQNDGSDFAEERLQVIQANELKEENI